MSFSTNKEACEARVTTPMFVGIKMLSFGRCVIGLRQNELQNLDFCRAFEFFLCEGMLFVFARYATKDDIKQR